MPASPLSRDLLPTTVAVWTAFLPPAAALWRRRSIVHEPAGQISICWLVMALVGSIGFVRLHLLGLSPVTTLGSIAAMLFPPLLTPPTLTWLGRRAKRGQWPVVVAWLGLCAVGFFVMRDARAFTVIADPIMATGMTALSAVTLATRVRRSPTAILRTDWFWILTGHLMYFAVWMFREPITEVLMAHRFDAVIAVHQAVMLLYAASYVVIARGMLLPRAVDAGSSYGTPTRQVA